MTAKQVLRKGFKRARIGNDIFAILAVVEGKVCLQLPGKPVRKVAPNEVEEFMYL